MGVTFTLDDGSTLDLGTIGPETEDVQYLGGPIHGAKWKTGDLLTEVQLGYNSCYCKLVVGTFTNPVVLNTQTPVTLTSESNWGDGFFNAAADACIRNPTH